MARFSRIEVALTMKESGLVPVFFNKDIEICKNILKACYEGGTRVFEFTNRGDRAHLVFQELIIWAEKEAPDMILGVGSIVEAGTTSIYIQLGANFIVSPVLNPDMAKVCNRRKVFWSPGCGSLSEISKAEELGAEVVKIFPGSQVGGPSFIKAVLGPCPWTSIMPTGGVSPDEENLSEWIKAGAHCVGIGSQLTVKDHNGNYDIAAITQKTKDAIRIISELRK